MTRFEFGYNFPSCRFVFGHHSPIHANSREFAIRIIGCYKYLIEEQRELVMSKQLLRCGTSIGANTRESKNAQSRMDFLNKLSGSVEPSP